MPAHCPPEHVSFAVHALPSSQGAVFTAYMQPRAGSHVSSVQGFPSLQGTGAPGMHTPSAQWSLPAAQPVQRLPSSHGFVLFTCTQPDAGSQESSVQTFASSQRSGAPPRHWPLAQASLVVQALPSLHAVPSGAAGFEHWPVPASQVPATWHGSEAVHTTGLELVHAPDWQASFRVHSLPSLHAVPSAFAGLLH